MKLKNLLLVGALTFGGLALTSCQASKDELEAVEKVLKGTLATESTSGAPLSATATTDLEGYANTHVSLTKSMIKKVSSGEKMNVSIEWSYDTSLAAYVKSVSPKDEEHDFMKFNYGHVAVDGEGNVEKDNFQVTAFELTAKVTCGKATAEQKYKVNLKHNDNIYDHVNMNEFYALNDAGNNFHFMDGTSIVGNHGQKYYYVAVSGKVEYISPDGNWGLLSDGEHVVELYQLTKSTDYNVIKEGEYFTVYGDISEYKGNVQLSYCNFIEPLADHSAIAPMVEYGDFKAGMNDPESADYVPFYAGINNRIGRIADAEVVKLLDKEGLEVAGGFPAFNKDARYIIVVELGGKTFWIAHDYHVASKGAAVGDELQSFVQGLHAGDHISVTGTIRYNAETVQEGGDWEVVPFASGQFSRVI